MRTLGLSYLWFAAAVCALGALSVGIREPALAVSLLACSALCTWAATERSPRALLALTGVPWILGIGMLSIASSSVRRDAVVAIVVGGVLWDGICVSIAMSVRRMRAAD